LVGFGLAVGYVVGEVVGEAVGSGVGSSVGTNEGNSVVVVGAGVFQFVGFGVGFFVGFNVGFFVGFDVFFVGSGVGHASSSSELPLELHHPELDALPLLSSSSSTESVTHRFALAASAPLYAH